MFYRCILYVSPYQTLNPNVSVFSVVYILSILFLFLIEGSTVETGKHLGQLGCSRIERPGRRVHRGIERTLLHDRMNRTDTSLRMNFA
jgi:hypothetical protein